MDNDRNKQFGQIITKLIAKQDLDIDESYAAFCTVLNNEVSEMQQGAFLAALTAKGEVADEVAGGWKAIYELDTSKVAFEAEDGIVDNCGTGMDTFKTFNISTAASIVAAGGGIKVARHGARAITSVCGTVDMAESLGVNVECDVEIVAESIRRSGLGLFNGMSPQVHPMALGRILSQISFGSPLNLAASLANPALPKIGVRGVYNRDLVHPIAQVMQSIGYTDAIVVYGTIDHSEKGMDEASVCGTSHAAQLKDGTIRNFSFEPEECGLSSHTPELLAPDKNRTEAATNMVALLSGRRPGACEDAVLLNSGLIFYVKDMVETILEGVEMSREIISSGKAMDTLRKWVAAQNVDQEQGIKNLQALEARIQP